MFVATMMSSMTVVHAHEGGEATHHHHGHDATAAACDHDDLARVAQKAGACVFSSAGDMQWHAHIWLFGLEVHVPLPQAHQSMPCDAGLSAPAVIAPLPDVTLDNPQIKISQSQTPYHSLAVVLDDTARPGDWNHRFLAPPAPSGRQLRALIASLLL
jgi:hypothetical protein